MARSVELALFACGCLALAGCSTTQQKSARAEVQAQRLLATRQRVLVTRTSPSVQVERVSSVRRGGRTAIAVLLRNRGGRPLNDLPIALRAAHGRYLNRRAGLGYFSTHIPAIAPGAEATWVFITRARVRGVTARVGARPAVTARPLRLPALATRGTTVTNSSSVPQYGLVVYGYATRGKRLVAAGRALLKQLGAGRSAAVHLSLIGNPRGATVRVEAPPTTFK
ncbi:MAG TPA: hypothetical protein VGF74_09015 [Thermoleophilaceae bacterium]